MIKKLLITSVALSGLVDAQCNKKCSYDRLPNGTITHVEGCNENITEMFESSATNYEDIFNKTKTKKCKIKKCLILIANGDTICWNHPRTDELFDSIYSRPSGPITPLTKSEWMDTKVLRMVE